MSVGARPSSEADVLLRRENDCADAVEIRRHLQQQL
jgi:hypothetical protein